MERNFIFKPYSASTNTELKEAVRLSSGPVWDVICADMQTGGRGRRGNAFFSPTGGAYFSAAYPLGNEAGNVPFLTLLAGLAAAETLDACGTITLIKWPNDLVMNGRKIAGILTEMSLEGETGALQYVVVGIGINVHEKAEDFPEEIRGIAGSIRSESGKTRRRRRGG